MRSYAPATILTITSLSLSLVRADKATLTARRRGQSGEWGTRNRVGRYDNENRKYHMVIRICNVLSAVRKFTFKLTQRKAKNVVAERRDLG